MSMPRPRVVVSQCLGFAAVRYDGQALRSRFVEALRDHVEFVQVCPEVGIGLGVPRDPIRIEVTAGGGAGSRDPEGRPPAAEREAGAGELRLVQSSTGRDLTEEMHAFAESFLEEVRPVDGFILKSRSPSCGIADAKRFQAGEEDPLDGRGPGLFARAVLERFPHAAVEDEARLADETVRRRFLEHVQAAARLREAQEAGTFPALARFHEEHAHLLAARDGEAAREMARLVTGTDAGSAKATFRAYVDAFARAMAGRRAAARD